MSDLTADDQAHDEVTGPAACRLAVYGSLAPGKPNHHHLADVPGSWSEGWVEGVLHDRGWGAGAGFPGIVLQAGASPVAVQLLESDELPAHWARLDAFEGEEYRRTQVAVHRTDTKPVMASIYALRT